MSQLKNNQVIILAANSAAIKSVHENYFEYDEVKISNPAIKKIVSYVASTINKEIEDAYGVIIDYEYVIFGPGHTPEKAGVVFFLESSLDKEITLEIIQKARSLAIHIVQKLLPGGDLFQEQHPASWLSQQKMEALDERQELFLTKWGNSKIPDGFSLLDAPEDEPLLCVDSEFITPEKRPTTSSPIDGAGLADGFSNSRNEVYILTIQESLQKTGDIRKFKVAHPDLLKIISEAAFKRLPVRFTATKTTDTTSLKSSYTLDTLQIDSTLIDIEEFKLTHEHSDMLTI